MSYFRGGLKAIYSLFGRLFSCMWSAVVVLLPDAAGSGADGIESVDRRVRGVWSGEDGVVQGYSQVRERDRGAGARRLGEQYSPESICLRHPFNYYLLAAVGVLLSLRRRGCLCAQKPGIGGGGRREVYGVLMSCMAVLVWP